MITITVEGHQDNAVDSPADTLDVITIKHHEEMTNGWHQYAWATASGLKGFTEYVRSHGVSQLVIKVLSDIDKASKADD